MKMCLGGGRVHSALRLGAGQCVNGATGVVRQGTICPSPLKGKGMGKLMLQLGHLVENRHLLQGMCRPQHVGHRLCLLEDRLVQGLEALQLPRLLLRLPLKNWSRHSSSSRVSCHLKTSPSNWCHRNSKNVLSSVKESFLRLLKGKPIMRNRNRSIFK